MVYDRLDLSWFARQAVSFFLSMWHVKRICVRAWIVWIAGVPIVCSAANPPSLLIIAALQVAALAAYKPLAIAATIARTVLTSGAVSIDATFAGDR